MDILTQRLESYQKQMSEYAEQHQVLLASDILQMIEQLQDDAQSGSDESVRQKKCVKELFSLLNEITEKAKRRDLSLFKILSIGGCDAYQGLPPICRITDSILEQYGDIIYDTFNERKEI